MFTPPLPTPPHPTPPRSDSHLKKKKKKEKRQKKKVSDCVRMQKMAWK